MRRKHLLLVLPVLAAAAIAAWAQGGTDRVRLAGWDHDLPRRYAFLRTVGLPREGDGSPWLILPAAEVSDGVPGYSRVFRGYVGSVPADLVVHVFDDPGGREFGRLRDRAWFNLDARLTFDFDLQQDSIGTAGRIPAYVQARLAAWRA